MMVDLLTPRQDEWLLPPLDLVGSIEFIHVASYGTFVNFVYPIYRLVDVRYVVSFAPTILVHVQEMENKVFGNVLVCLSLPIGLLTFRFLRLGQFCNDVVHFLVTSRGNRRNLVFRLGCPNRPLALDQFLDSPCQSRLSHAWWRSSFKEKGVIQACQLRPIGICPTG